MNGHQTKLSTSGETHGLIIETWPTTLLVICQTISQKIFNSTVTAAASRFAAALDVPEYFIVQLLYVEDKRFLLHPGVDPLAVARAIVANSSRSGVVQGASTITQQLYNVRRNARGIPHRRGLTNKVSQAVWALAEELHRSKLEILEEYLRTAYWGYSYYGIDEATFGYFGTTRKRLTIAQSFFLVERLASPNSIPLGRIQSLLQQNAISEVFLQDTQTREELLTLYDKNLQCGDKLREVLR